MSRWLSLFAEYNFSVDYKLGRLKVVADALSRRPDFELTAQPDTSIITVELLTSSFPSSILLEDIRKAYDPEAEANEISLATFPEEPKPDVGSISILNIYIYSLQRFT